MGVEVMVWVHPSIHPSIHPGSKAPTVESRVTLVMMLRECHKKNHLTCHKKHQSGTKSRASLQRGGTSWRWLPGILPPSRRPWKACSAG